MYNVFFKIGLFRFEIRFNVYFYFMFLWKIFKKL